jgi:hypothetical protein
MIILSILNFQIVDPTVQTEFERQITLSNHTSKNLIIIIN